MLEFLSFEVEIYDQRRPHPMKWNGIAFLKWITLRLFFLYLSFFFLGVISLPHGIVKRMADAGQLLFSRLGLHLISLSLTLVFNLNLFS